MLFMSGMGGRNCCLRFCSFVHSKSGCSTVLLVSLHSGQGWGVLGLFSLHGYSELPI